MATITKNWKFFPVQANGKKPAIAGWQQFAEDCKAPSAVGKNKNVGLFVSGSKLFVLDVDPRHGGEETLRLLPPISPTFTVKTPSGGTHYYFSDPDGWGRNTEGVIGPGIDTRGKGGFVLFPPSTIDGIPYKIISDTPPVLVPQWVKEKLDSTKKEPLKAPEEITDGTRGSMLFRLAAGMRRYGLNYDEILAALETANLNRCLPPVDDSRIQAIALSASKYTPETVLAAQDFPEPDGDLPSIPAEELAAASPPPREWIIESWLPLGEITSLYGGGGNGKSLLALQLANAVSTGNDFLGLPVATQLPVLAVFCEDQQDEVHRRLHDVLAAQSPTEQLFPKPPTKFLLWPRAGLTNDLARLSDHGNDVVPGPFRATLEAELKTMPPGPKLVILDTLSDIYLGDENTRALVNKFVKTILGSLVKEFELTLLLVAHPSKTTAVGGYSGSTAWENAVRNRLGFFPHEHLEDIMVLKRMKSNYAKRGEEICMEWQNGAFRRVSTADEKAKKVKEITVGLIAGIHHFMEKNKLSLSFLAKLLREATSYKPYISSNKTRSQDQLREILLSRPCYGGFIYGFRREVTNGRDYHFATKTKVENAENIDEEMEENWL